MFIADSFFKVLNATPLVQEYLYVLYSNLEPTPIKVLSAIKFPEEMSSDEKVLSQYLKRLVREMDDPQNLQLFLRFCTGSDIMTKMISKFVLYLAVYPVTCVVPYVRMRS